MVKYKVLKPAAHNFSHSFVSFNNYMAGGFVIDDREKLEIFWIPDKKQNAI